MNDIHSLYAGIVSVNAGTNAMLKERFQRMCSQLCYGAGLNIGGQTGFNTNLLLGEENPSAPDLQWLLRHVQYAPHPVHESPARCFPAGSFACMDGNMPARITRAVEVRRTDFPETKFITG